MLNMYYNENGSQIIDVATTFKYPNLDLIREMGSEGAFG